MNRLRELEQAATPGPWRWAGRVDRPMITTVHGGMVYVMGFIRSGMQGAQPTFQVREDGNGRMVPASALAVREVSYRDDIVDIDHPDARLLIALRNLAPELLDVVDAARAIKRTSWYAIALGRKDTAAMELWNTTVALDEKEAA